MSPNKFEKKNTCVQRLTDGTMGQTWFQDLPIAIQVVRLDRFCCPVALTIAVKKNLSRAFVAPIFLQVSNYNYSKHL